MKEYIDRQSVLSAIDMSRSTHKAVGERLRIDDVVWIIKNARAADVAPVVHGKWIFDDHDEYGKHYKCSRCGEGFITVVPGLPEYCHCGAKMDGGKQ